MADIERWRKAQDAEKEYHPDIRPMELEWFSKKFDISLEVLLSQKCILEVGCGTGGLTYAHNIQEHVKKVVGVDPIIGKLSNSELASEPVIQAAGESLPFKGNRFDVAASINVLDHCIEPPQVLNEIARVLKPEGIFIIKINAFSVPESVRSRLHHVDRPHPHHFSPDEVRNLLHSCGFTIEHELVDTRDLFGGTVMTANSFRRNFKEAVASALFRFRTLYLRCTLSN